MEARQQGGTFFTILGLRNLPGTHKRRKQWQGPPAIDLLLKVVVKQNDVCTVERSSAHCDFNAVVKHCT